MPSRNKYVTREPRSTIYVAFCRINGPCDHVWHDSPEAGRDCAKTLTESTGHWHHTKEASRISGSVFDRRPMYPSRTIDGKVAKIGVHPLTPGEPCR